MNKKRNTLSKLSKQIKIKLKGNKKNSLELQYSTAEVLVPSLILLAFLILIFIGILNIIEPKSIYESDIEIQNRLWEESFRSAEKNRVGVTFNAISTSRYDYELMQNEALQFANREYGKTEVDTQVDVSVTVNEKLYVDGLDQEDVTSQPIDSIDKDIRETGPIYFNDMLMLRYITEEGHMRVIISLLDESSSSNVIATKQSDLVDKLIKANKFEKIKIDTELVERLLSNRNEELIKEREYLIGLADSTIELLKTQSQTSLMEAERRAIKYYTIEGKQTVYGSRNDIKISEDSTIELMYIAAGKSDINRLSKDRVYMQIKITEPSGEEQEAYIILKLNSNLRIFDIDVV